MFDLDDDDYKNKTVTFRDFVEFDIAMILWQYVAPFLIVTGTLGSILSIIVLTRRKLQSVTTMFYLIILAFADATVLNTGLLRHWVSFTFSYDMRLDSNFACKVHTFMVYLALDYSAWILVVLTLDRCLCVCLPFKATIICNVRNARIITAGILAVLVLANMHYFWTYALVEKTIFGRGIDCYVASPSFKVFIEDVWPWLDFCIVCVFPFSIMIFCNILIIRKLVKTSQKIWAHRKSDLKNSRFVKENPQQLQREHVCKNEQREPSILPLDEYSDVFPTKAQDDQTNDLSTDLNKNAENWKIKNGGSSKMFFVNYDEDGTHSKLQNGHPIKISDNYKFNYPTKIQNGQSTEMSSGNGKNDISCKTQDQLLGKNTSENLKAGRRSLDSCNNDVPGKVKNGPIRSFSLSDSMCKVKGQRCVSESSQPGTKMKISSLTVMLLSVNGLFLLLMSPIVVYLIGFGSWKVSPEPREEARLMLGWAAVNMLQYTNNAIHFFLYYLTVPSFRRLFLSLLKCSGKVNPENFASDNNSRMF